MPEHDNRHEAISAPGRAIGYCRVSTAEQAGSGLGLDAQQTAIAGGAARLGIPLADLTPPRGAQVVNALKVKPLNSGERFRLWAINAFFETTRVSAASRDRGQPQSSLSPRGA